MERDFNNSARCDSPSLKDSEADQSLVGKVKSIITPLSKWFRKQDDDSQITRKRDEDELEDDMLQMQPPSKRVKLPNDIHGNNCNNNTSNKLPPSDISSFRNFTNFPEPVAGPSGIKCRKTFISHTSYTSETLNGHKDSDSEDSTSGYSSVARIGSREQVYQSLESSKQPSPTQHTINIINNSSNTAVNRSLFTDRTMSAHMNTSLSSRRPFFNASTFGSPNFVDKTLSTKKIINSPFYSGKTVYGGASAYGRKLGRTELDLKKNLKNSVQIKPVNQQKEESNNLVLGKTARRILETLEQYSSPISDAKKIPVASKKPKEGLISKYVGANPYMVRETKGALRKELQVPSVTDLLLMKQKTRLQDSTEAVRQIAKSSKSDLNSESYKLAANEEEKEKHTGKMRAKISSVRQKAPVQVDTPVSEVSLKPISLPITTLPKFDIVIPPPMSVVTSKSPEKPAPMALAIPPVAPVTDYKPQQTENKQKGNSGVEFKFSDPVVIAENLKSIIAMNNFKFSEPLCKQIQKEVAGGKVTLNFKMPENKLPLLVPSKTKNNGDTLGKAPPVLKTGSVMDILGKKNESLSEKFKPAKDTWECNTCLIRNSADKTKCAACETPRNKKSTENKMEFGSQFKMTQDKWECTACLVRNSNIDTKCVSCTTPKPLSTTSTNAPTVSTFGDKFKPQAGTWECPVCMIQNKMELSKCAACEAPNPKPTSAVQSAATGFGDKFKPATNTWECSSCMVRNKGESNKCIACESPRNGTVKTSGGFGSSFKAKEDEWECTVCMVKNKNSMSKCQCCETAKPGSSSNVLNKSDEQTPIAKFNFGIDKTTAASFSFGVPPAAQQKLPKLGVQPANIFGEAAKSTASSSSTPAFSFGVPSSAEKKEPAKQEEKKATGVTNPLLRPDEKLPEKAQPAAAGFKFGLTTPAATDSKDQSKTQDIPKTTSETTSKETKAMFKFSASPSTTTLFGGNKSDSATLVKSDSTAAPLMFSSGSNASSTPQTTTASQPAVTKAQTTATFSFGSTATKTVSESSNSLFGAGLGSRGNATSSGGFGSTAGAGTASPFSTGSAAPAAAAEVGPFQFGTASSAAPSSSSTSSEPAAKAAMFQFGQSASSAASATPAPAPSGGFSFEPAAAASAPAFNFGAGTSSTPVYNFGQTAPAQQKTAGFNFGASQSQPQQQSSGGPEFKFGAAAMSTPSGFNFSAAAPTFDVNTKPQFNFTGGSLPSFSAQPTADGGAPVRKIKKAVRRTQR